MTLDNFEKVARRFAPYVDQITALNLHGCGEPLLDKSLAKKISLARDIGFSNIGFSSNCNLLSEKKTQELLRAGLNCLIASIDGFSKDVQIENGVTELLVKDPEGYVAAIGLLYRDKPLRKRLGSNAKNAVTKMLSPWVAFCGLESAYDKTMGLEKSARNIKFSCDALNHGDNADIGARLFIESLGHQANEFMQNYVAYDQPSAHSTDYLIANVEPELRVPNKGSLLQFLRYFPEDVYLNYWANFIGANEINSTGTITD